MDHKNKNWFTLIELLIVITILSILTVIWFMSYNWYVSQSRDYKRVSDISLIKTSLNTYSKMHGWGIYYKPEKAPTSWSGIVYSGATSNIISYQIDIDNKLAWVLGISNLPTDPLTNTYYVYWVSRAWINYQIATILEWDDTKTAYNPLISQTYAAWCTDIKSYVDGNYIPKDIKNDIPWLIYSFNYKTSNLDISNPTNKKK